MKNLIIGVMFLMLLIPPAVLYMFQLKQQHVRAAYVSEVRGYVIAKGLTDQATPFVTLKTPDGPVDVLVGDNAVYDRTELYDIVLKHANCDAVRVLKGQGILLCANMLSLLEVQKEIPEVTAENYCNCQTIAEPEPIEEEVDSLEQMKGDSLKTVAFDMSEVPLSRREYITELYMAVNAMVLPDSICSFPNVERLSIWFSRAPQLDISKLACLDSLEVLSITDTYLKKIIGDPTALKHLKTLDLSDNMIDRMPDFICALTELEYLHLNSWDRTIEIPDCISNLVNLQLLTFCTRNYNEPPVVYPVAEQERIRKLLPHARVMF